MRRIYSKLAKLLKLNYENRQVRILLESGLCNKLHCLFSACDILLERKAFLVEPNFGWKETILFSDIYDIEHFNRVIKKYYGVDNFMIPQTKVSKNRFFSWIVIHNHINLWAHSEKVLSQEREVRCIERDSTKIIILEALKLNEECESIAKRFFIEEDLVALQIRTESDWKSHASITKTGCGESVYVGVDSILSMLQKTLTKKTIFFTSGENHKDIVTSFKRLGYSVDYFYDPTLEYEINAAINFEICCRTSSFVGNSRSTFSNLITLKRFCMMNNDNSYIYNYEGEIRLRVDKGLYTEAFSSVTNHVSLC